MGQLSKLAGQTAIYGVSSIVGRFLSYLLVPLYTAVFARGEYGVVTELYAYIAFLNIVFTYGLETAYFRFATKSGDNQTYFNLTQSSVLVSSLFLGGLIFALAGPIASLLGYEDKEYLIRWISLILTVDAVVAIPFARLRLEGKARRFAFLKITNIVINISLNIFFLIAIPYFKWEALMPQSISALGVGYVFLSNLLANLIYLPFFSNYLTQLNFSLNKRLVPVLLYALPLFVMGLAGVTNEMLSRAMLKFLLPEGFYPDQTNIEALGVFGACYKFSVFMTLAIQAFRYASEPFFFSRAADKESPLLFSRVMHAFIIFATFSWLTISLWLHEFAPIILRRPEYLTGLGIVPWLLGGGVFLGIYFNLSVWYKLTDRTIFGAWISIFGAIMTIVLNLLLIPMYGYLGGAIASFFSYFSMMIISLYLGQRYYPIPYEYVKGFIYIILSAVFIFAFYFWGVNHAAKYLIMICFMSLFLLVVYLMDIKSGFFGKSNSNKP